MSAPMIMRPPKATATRSVGCKVAAAKAANPVPDMAPAAEVAKPVPDMGKRTILNGILVGAAAVPATAMAAGFISFFVPPKSGGDSSGVAAKASAKDAAGNLVKASAYLESHHPGDVSLVQGLKGDPTYLIVTRDSSFETFGLNAICTHMGCVVPWVPAENKFICPCHNSQYNSQGKVVRGPAPLSLALAHIDVADDTVTLTPWTETDFRTDQSPWWA